MEEINSQNIDTKNVSGEPVPGSPPPAIHLPAAIAEKMEIHHHSPAHGKKKIREYFFEFFMLFLAVFLGFVAENIRESVGESHREKIYAVSLIRDLRSDTSSLVQTINANEERIKDFDSLSMLLKNPVNTINKNAALIYYHFIPTTLYNEFVSSKRTIDQLENAGNMRLFKDMEVSDSITSYYEMVKQVEGQFATFMRYFDMYHDEAFNVFSYSQIENDFWNRGQLLKAGRALKLSSTDAQTLDKFASKLFVLKTLTHIYDDDLKLLHKQAASTIRYVKEKYKMQE